MAILMKHIIYFFHFFHLCFATLRDPTLCIDGTEFLPSATACDNIRDDEECAGIFREAIVASPAQVDINCVNPIMEVVINQCAKRCAVCCEQPEFSCGDDENTPIDCPFNKHKCRDPEWTYVMDYFCPGTCGSCLTAEFCRDLNPNCANMRSLCNDINFMNFMTARCARTCSRCTLTTTVANTTSASCSTVCTDVATNCIANIALCNIAEYYNLMTQKCSATCGRCSSTGTIGSSTCMDTNPNCAAWVRNGFCSNIFYTAAQKRQYCGRSCNLC